MNIDGYEKYVIYDNGVVENSRGKMLKYQANNRGYLRVSLSKNGLSRNFLVHRLVALYYIPNPNNYAFVDHIDRNIYNNDVSNLRWVNASMNNLNRSCGKNNKLNEKNISFDKNVKRYVFTKSINFKRHKKYFKTLEEAINYRDNVFLEQHHEV